MYVCMYQVSSSETEVWRIARNTRARAIENRVKGLWNDPRRRISQKTHQSPLPNQNVTAKTRYSLNAQGACRGRVRPRGRAARARGAACRARRSDRSKSYGRARVSHTHTHLSLSLSLQSARLVARRGPRDKTFFSRRKGKRGCVFFTGKEKTSLFHEKRRRFRNLGGRWCLDASSSSAAATPAGSDDLPTFSFSERIPRDRLSDSRTAKVRERVHLPIQSPNRIIASSRDVLTLRRKASVSSLSKRKE